MVPAFPGECGRHLDAVENTLEPEAKFVVGVIINVEEIGRQDGGERWKTLGIGDAAQDTGKAGMNSCNSLPAARAAVSMSAEVVASLRT